MVSKKENNKSSFYLPILNALKDTTNLSKIQESLNISKQQLNYYLRQLKQRGLIVKKSKGWYEVVKISKNSTKYENLFSKDTIRGHAYIWNLKLEQEILSWRNRIKILDQKGINYKLVGALKDTPRIKVLGRKVWLCNNHLRVFDRKEESYYGDNAKESRYTAFQEIKRIVGALNNKLGTNLKPTDISFQKEHYALIKNDLAIEENRRGNIWRIQDEEGEWLLVDDSLEKGGELETVGKKAFQTNIPMQKWWNDQKKHNFEVTPTFLLNSMNQVTQNQLMFNKNFESHVYSIKELGNSARANSKTTELLASVVSNLSNQVKDLKLEILSFKSDKKSI